MVARRALWERAAVGAVLLALLVVAAVALSWWTNSVGHISRADLADCLRSRPGITAVQAGTRGGLRATFAGGGAAAIAVERSSSAAEDVEQGYRSLGRGPVTRSHNVVVAFAQPPAGGARDAVDACL